MSIKEVKVNCFQPERYGAAVQIKHLGVNINMLCVCDQPECGMMVFFVGYESEMKFLEICPLWTQESYSLQMIFGPCEAIASGCQSCLSRWIHWHPAQEKKKSTGIFDSFDIISYKWFSKNVQTLESL